METGHKGIIAHLQRKDVIEVPDDAVTFFDDCASACPEDLSPCCGPGSRTYAENTTRSRQKHDYLVSSSFPSTSKDLVPPLSDSSVSKTFSSTQARYSTQTYIRPHISDVESIASVSANAKGTVIATANLETAVATIVRRSDSTMAEASTPAVVGAPMATEIVPDATTLMSSTTGSIQTTTAAGPDRPKESNAETHGMPPMSIAVLVIAGIVLVAVSLLGLGCWMKRRRRPPSVHEMVEVEEELDELHELGQQHTNNKTDGSRHLNPFSINGSDKPEPIWLFPNGTALINGTTLGYPNGTAYANSHCSNNTTIISSTGTATNLTPAMRPNSEGGPNDNAGANTNAEPRTNDGPENIGGTSLTVTENIPNAAGLTSSNSIPASTMIPAIVIPLVLAVLLVVALLWCCHYRKHKKSEDSEKAYPDPSDPMNFHSSARMSRPPQDPAYTSPPHKFLLPFRPQPARLTSDIRLRGIHPGSE
ncbi:hypothetical protein EG328_009270 [Venturia inaequalis]|uniref:Uncharacterized protein n=1 Tax=Venturia inaequalis TaxID=5025 RepID=A0A8H3VAA0_VENIN|nr:hypothetical protein EG328_009270 [Venturia inaequalis]